MNKGKETSTGFCKRCLIYEEAEQYKEYNITSYVQQIPFDVRAEEAQYKHRLGICRDCNKQFQGMCRLCGCFIEVRAAVRIRICPDTPARW